MAYMQLSLLNYFDHQIDLLVARDYGVAAKYYLELDHHCILYARYGQSMLIKPHVIRFIPQVLINMANTKFLSEFFYPRHIEIIGTSEMTHYCLQLE